MNFDPDLQQKKPPRKKSASQKPRAEIRIWVTQPKLDCLESAIGQLCEREPEWRKVAMVLAKEAQLIRLEKVLYSLDETAASRQQALCDPPKLERVYGEDEK